MQQFAIVMMPFFAAVVCGYGGAKLKWVPNGIVITLNAFVIYIALPAMIIRALASQTFDEIADLNFVGAYLAAWLLVFIVTALIGRLLFATSFGESVIQGYSGSYANTGYLGLPVLAAVLGDWAVPPVAIIVAADIAVTIPIVLFLLETNKNAMTSWATWTKNVLLRTLSQPLLIAVIIGLFLTNNEIRLAPAIGDTMQFLGVTAAPCALFALGASLASRPFPKRIAEVFYLSLIKLVLHPVVALFFMIVVFTIEPDWIKVGLLATAFPTAATVFVLAEHYNMRVAAASSTVLITTLASLITLPTLAYFVLA